MVLASVAASAHWPELGTDIESSSEFVTRELIGILGLEDKALNANYPRCQSTGFTWTSSSFGGVVTMLIYRSSCGAVAGVFKKD
jgi:hypothetical protein